jgi:hypothetical protein
MTQLRGKRSPARVFTAKVNLGNTLHSILQSNVSYKNKSTDGEGGENVLNGRRLWEVGVDF